MTGRAPDPGGRPRGVVPAAAAAVLLAAALPTAAQETPPDTAPRGVGDLTVTVTRTPVDLRRASHAVSVVDARRATARERRTSLAEVLHTVPGVQVSDRRNFSLGDRVVMRGVGSRAQFGVRGIKVIVDGVPLTLPDGQTTLTNLDLGSAARVEVLRGPASALYGNAGGGVLRVTSGGFADAPLAPTARLTAGQDGFRTQELGASGRAGGWDWLLHARHLETDGWRRHAAAETWRANLVARKRLGERGELRAVLNAFDMPFGENPSTLPRERALEEPRAARDFIVAQGAGESASQLQAGATLRTPLGGGLDLRASAWAAGRDLRNPIPGRIIDLERLTGGARVEVDGGPDRTPGVAWTAGLDAEVQRDDRRESENLGVGADGGRAEAGAVLLDQRETVAYAAPFLRVRARPSTALSLTGALRLDAYRFEADDRRLADGDDSGRREMAQISPSLGLAWTPREGTTLYANLATAFETPTTSELSNRPDGRAGFHPELDPQETRSLEAGVRLSLPGSVRVEAALYDAAVDRALVPREGPGGQVFFRNAGRLSRRGAELSTAWRPAPRWEAVLAYALQDYRFDRFRTADGDFSGNDEPGVPGHRVDASLTGTLPGALRLEVDATWVDAFPVDDANTAFDVSRRTVDLRLGREAAAGGWRLRPFLGIDNVLDERYNASVVPNAFGGNYFEPAPGRRVYGGLEVDLPRP